MRRIAGVVVASLVVASCASGCVPAPGPPAASMPVSGMGTGEPFFGVGCPESQHDPFPTYGAAQPTDRSAEPIFKVQPQYPDDALRNGVDGTVIVAALVCEHGNVIETRIVRSIALLDESAEKAVSQWKFIPAQKSGRAVACWFEAPVQYSSH